jgi:uncharacterized BrkB/YihY/UPF0761 family membrane protein
MVMILSWVYYSALVFLLGAEFTRVYSTGALGAHPRAEAGAARVDTTKPEAKVEPAAAAHRARPEAARAHTPPDRRRQA